MVDLSKTSRRPRRPDPHRGHNARRDRGPARGDRRRDRIQLLQRGERRGRRGRDAASRTRHHAPGPALGARASSSPSRSAACSGPRSPTRSASWSQVPAADVVAVIGAGVSGALAWNLLSWWRGLPSSSTHALVGGLVGAAIVADGSRGRWSTVGRCSRPVLSPALGFAAGFVGARASRGALRRATREIKRPVGWGSGELRGLAFAHGRTTRRR